MIQAGDKERPMQWKLINSQDFTQTFRDEDLGGVVTVSRPGDRDEYEWSLHHYNGWMVARETGVAATVDQALEAAGRALCQARGVVPEERKGEDAGVALSALRSRDGELVIVLGPGSAVFVEQDRESRRWTLCLQWAGHGFWRMGEYESEDEARGALTGVVRWIDDGARGVYAL